MRTRRALGWVAAVLLVVLPSLVAPRGDAGARPPLVRLLGPIARLAAAFELVRAHQAFSAGHHGLGFARAEHAFALDPESTDAWALVAHHQGLNLASVEREADPERRLRWVRAAVETTERGEREARDPAALAILRATILRVHAELDPELPWPGGNAALWEGSARAFERAHELGFEEGLEYAELTREAAHEHAPR